LKCQWSSWSINPVTRYCTKQFNFNSDHVGKLYKVIDNADGGDLVDGAVEDSDTSDDDLDDDDDDMSL